MTMRLSGTVMEIWRLKILNAQTWTWKKKMEEVKEKEEGGWEGKGKGNEKRNGR